MENITSRTTQNTNGHCVSQHVYFRTFRKSRAHQYGLFFVYNLYFELGARRKYQYIFDGQWWKIGVSLRCNWNWGHNEMYSLWINRRDFYSRFCWYPLPIHFLKKSWAYIYCLHFSEVTFQTDRQMHSQACSCSTCSEYFR